MQATIETTIDGMKLKHTGRFRKSDNTVIDSKGMKLSFRPGDKITFHEPKKRTPAQLIECPFDLHQWFKKSKQITC
jgi:hypothetical protein